MNEREWNWQNRSDDDDEAQINAINDWMFIYFVENVSFPVPASLSL